MFTTGQENSVILLNAAEELMMNMPPCGTTLKHDRDAHGHVRNRGDGKRLLYSFLQAPQSISATARLWHNKTFVIGLCASEVDNE